MHPYPSPLLGSSSGSAVTTWNPAALGSNLSLSNGNLRVTQLGPDGFSMVLSTTSKTTGKWYFEVTNSGGPGGGGAPDIGVVLPSTALNGFIYNGANVGYVTDGNIRANGAGTLATTTAWSASGAVACVAVDFAARLLWFRVPGGLWNNDASANPATGTNGIAFTGAASSAAGGSAFCIAACVYHSSPADIFDLNCGQSAFAGSVPTGFSPWG